MKGKRKKKKIARKERKEKKGNFLATIAKIFN